MHLLEDMLSLEEIKKWAGTIEAQSTLNLVAQPLKPFCGLVNKLCNIGTSPSRAIDSASEMSPILGPKGFHRFDSCGASPA
jgi:hypothetical protein